MATRKRAGQKKPAVCESRPRNLLEGEIHQGEVVPAGVRDSLLAHPSAWRDSGGRALTADRIQQYWETRENAPGQHVAGQSGVSLGF